MLNKITLLIFLVFLISCSDNNITDIIEKKTEIKLEYTFQLPKKNENINFNIGIWMFNNKAANKNSIANWINVQHLGKTILEPINLLWIDFNAKNKEESTRNIVDFLKLNNFIVRSGSSEGYFSFFEENKWVPQYKETWSDKKNPNTINNHGRIFIAHEINKNVGETFFISSGAFSIEDENHLYLSFKDALKQFNEVEKWSIYKERLDVGNIIDFENYSTFDHEGVKVFILN